MKEIITNWIPQNKITTPIQETPVFVNSGIIKAVMTSGEKISVAQIDYEEFSNEQYQYTISPYWDMIDALTADIFQGIPGIDMDLRLNHYYRANYLPVFITERTPSKNREDLWELLESVGLDYYDRFEWLLRTNMRSSQDNLIVERRRLEQEICEYSGQSIENLQYGDRVIVDSIESISNNLNEFSDIFFKFISNGVDITDRTESFSIEALQRTAILRFLIFERKLYKRKIEATQKKGINQAKEKGLYQGRKPIEVDPQILLSVAQDLKKNCISVQEAMKRTKISSRSTFYRKMKKYEEEYKKAN